MVGKLFSVLTLAGVYTIEPKTSIVGTFKQSIPLGTAPVSQSDVVKIIEELRLA